MLSIGKLTPGRENYYLSALAATTDEYYLDPAEIPGHWHGALAEALGLAGRVDPEAFRAVLDGRHPDGHPLVQGAGTKGRVAGFDLTFSAPKSVSVLWALAAPGISDVVAAAHDGAVADALAVLEHEAVRARRGHAGGTQIPGRGLVAAGFGHRTSRAGDPQLHTHLVVANLTLGTDGRWSAPDGRVLYGWARTAGYLYQAALRARLTESLGLAWTEVRKGVGEVQGIDKAQREAFSSRRAQIEAELARVGHDSPAAARTATLTTRPAKDRSLGLDELRAGWTSRAREVGLDVTPLVHAGRAAAHHDLAAPLLSPDGLTAQATGFDRRDVLRQLANGHRDGAPPALLQADTDRLVSDPRIIPLATSTPAGGARWTTAELVALETRLVDQAQGRQGDGTGVAPRAVVDRVVGERPTLSPEQAAMVTRLATSGAGIEVVVGRAGTGKTFALDAARTAWERSGHHVIGTALAARAAAGLQAGTGIRSDTFDRLLADLDRGGPLAALTAKSVVIVDEAGMVGTRKLGRLLDLAQQAQGKVVLVGDPRQLPEIDAGGLVSALARRLGAIELTANRRQEEAWERAALDELRSGTVATAVGAYHRAGRLTLAASAEAARQALVDDWWIARQNDGDVRTAAMYALGRSDVDDLNRRARTLLRNAGMLSGPDVTIAGKHFAVGDTVLALRNDRRLGVRNGTVGTLVELTAEHARLHTADGPVILPIDYLTHGQLTHAYATTIHKAQGATVDHAFLLGSDKLFREAGYVGLSRARKETRLYLVEPAPEPNGIRPAPTRELTAALSLSRAQTLAADQLPHPEQPAHPDRQALLSDPPAWATDALGPPPLFAADRQLWADSAERIAAYRADHQLDAGTTPDRSPESTDPRRRAVETAIGPEPAEPARRRAWTLARLAILQTRDRTLDRHLHRERTR